jgi:hypothetical protein
MDFKVETEKITTNTIENFINILLSMIPITRNNKCLLQIFLIKIHEVFECFQVKLNMSFSQMECMLWMMVRIKESLPYRPDLCRMSPFTVLAYLYSCFIISFKFLFDEPFSIKNFSNLINPNIMKLAENENLVLILLKYDLHPSELEFVLYKNLLI